MSVTQALLGPLLADGAPKPLITHYDDATGARIELSRATTANWAAKTANWLVDEWDLEPGTPVHVALPAHWQTVGVLLGAWWCGAHITDDPRGAEVSFVPAGELDRGAGARTVAAVGLDALGAPLRGLPDGVADYVSDIRVHGDDFSPMLPIDGDTPALLERSVDELVADARERAEELHIGPTDRVLSTVEWHLPGGVLGGLLAVLAGRSSLVHCTNLDPAKRESRRDTERTTVELGD
ncbi:TIGR03089 family protein [Saccharopolyspora kobensis]|uniref:TIGR03089 family protein n=1 Tax=Saccharopolyspora kobensis TaxID=146035 RepID=A0A1H6ENG7_9PSEU|nr:TIGR03089 family protein [Saccharopolyspora kobensis]SEG98556.1 TIGR03089 family protein [Saccharopolyspora kobensis]SFF28578.1 TIGR03089 family protein [Saccharopolyspora kobensis]